MSKSKNPYRSKGGKFRVPGRRLPKPSDFRMSDRVVERKRKEDFIPKEPVYVCGKCERYFLDSEGIWFMKGGELFFECYGCCEL